MLIDIFRDSILKRSKKQKLVYKKLKFLFFLRYCFALYSLLSNANFNCLQFNK